MKLLSLKALALSTMLCLFSSFASAEGSAPESIEGTTRITAEDLINLFDELDDLVLVDARIDKDRTGGFIEGSVSIPDVVATPELLAKHIPTKATPVVFYCNGPKCGRSVKTSKMAVKEGYTKVYWFRGGWEEWTANNLPISN
jgi:rhodanese-related sulfurtransferase